MIKRLLVHRREFNFKFQIMRFHNQITLEWRELVVARNLNQHGKRQSFMDHRLPNVQYARLICSKYVCQGTGQSGTVTTRNIDKDYFVHCAVQKASITD